MNSAEGCYTEQREGATLESSCRSCSPDQGDCRQEPSDVGSEVTVRATEEPTVSSLICSGLQTINGSASVGERAWEDSYEPQQCGAAELSCSSGGGEPGSTSICDHVALQQHEEPTSQLEPYPPPIPVVSL